jgi:predicted nucleic-acid-binding protein
MASRMIAVDTNILVRYAVNDEPTQSLQAKNFTQKYGRNLYQ